MLEIMEQIKVMDRDEQLSIAASILNMESDFEDDLSEEEVEEMLERERKYLNGGKFISANELLAQL